MRADVRRQAANVFRGWGMVILTAVALGLALGSYYYLRSGANSRAFTERNLRQLARMGQGIQGRLDNFSSIFAGVKKAAEEAAAGEQPQGGEAVAAAPWSTEPNAPEGNAAARACPGGRPAEACAARTAVALIRPQPVRDPVISVGPNREPDRPDRWTRLALEPGTGLAVFDYRSPVASRPGTVDGLILDVEVAIDLDTLLLPLLETEFFDHVFLADRNDAVVLQTGVSELRLQQVPEPAAADADNPSPPERDVSRAVRVVIAGKDYELFMQPIPVGLEPAPDDGGNGNGNRLVLGGLVSTQRFRTESLALNPNEMAALTLLIGLAALGWPFIKVLARGPRDALRRRDILFLGYSLVMLLGLTTLFLLDAGYYYDLRRQTNDQLEATNQEIRARFNAEIEDALGQLAELSTCYYRQSRYAPFALTDLLRRFPHGVARYPYFQSVFWTDEAGEQQAKWATGPEATSRRSLGHRTYVRRVVEGRLWPHDPQVGASLCAPETQTRAPRDPAVGGTGLGKGYFVQSIRSVSTGEFLTAVSAPCLRSDPEDYRIREPVGCHVAAMVTELVSLTRPVLPPGTGFAIIDRDGKVMYHSRPERALEENFFAETENNAHLRAAVAARKPELVGARYLGRDVSVFTAPVDNQSPLTVVVFQDKNLVRTLNFEPLLFSAGVFVAYASLLLLLVTGLSFLDQETRLRWTWPDWRTPPKYLLLSFSSILFAGEMVRQGIMYPSGPVVINTCLLALLAAGFGLVILARVAGAGAPLTETLPHSDQFRYEAENTRWSRLRVYGSCWVAVCLLAIIYVGFTNDHGMWVVPTLISALVGAITYRYNGIRWPGRWSLPSIGPLYVGALAISVIAVSAVPAAVILSATYHEHVELLVRYGQLDIARQTQERWAWLENKHGEALAVAGARDPGEIAGEPLQAADHHLDFGGKVYRSVQRGWMAGSFFDTCYEIRIDAGDWVSEGDCWSADRLEPDRHNELQATLWRFLPFLTEFSVEMRGLFAREGWSVRAPHDASGLRTKVLFLEPDVQRAGATVRLKSVAPTGVALSGWWAVPSWLFLLLVAVALVRLKAKRVYLMPLGLNRPHSIHHVRVPSRVEDSLLIVAPPWTDRTPLRKREDVFPVDLRLLVDDEDKVTVPELPAVEENKAIIVDHVERIFSHRLLATESLAWIEELAYREGRPLILISCRDLTPNALDALVQEEKDEELRERWLALQGGFDKVEVCADIGLRVFHDQLTSCRVPFQGDRPEEGRLAQRRWDRQESEVFSLLSTECRASKPLQRLARNLARSTDLVKLGRAGVIETIRDAAEVEYRALWSCLAESEQMVAGQLARGGLISRQQRSPLRRLMARGLVVRDPELRLFNESFASFVRDQLSEEAQLAWEAGGERSMWRQLRQPLLLSLVVLAIFLFATQRELFNAGMAFVSATAVAIPALFRLFGAMQSTQREPAGQ